MPFLTDCDSIFILLPQNLREIFDNPPDIYDTYRLGELDGGESIAKAALHVVVMDEVRSRASQDETIFYSSH